jgi:hypothetical protein
MSLFAKSGLLHQEYVSHQELELAFEKSRKKHTITQQDRKLPDPGSALDLCCVNHFARLRWSKAFCREIEEFFALDNQNTFPDQPLFFVTLTDFFVPQITMNRGLTSTNSKGNFRRG